MSASSTLPSLCSAAWRASSTAGCSRSLSSPVRGNSPYCDGSWVRIGGWVNWGRAAGRSGVGSTVRGLARRAKKDARDGREARARAGWGKAGSVAGTHRAVNFAREIFHRHVEPHPPRLAAPEHAPGHGHELLGVGGGGGGGQGRGLVEGSRRARDAIARGLRHAHRRPRRGLGARVGSRTLKLAC